MNKTRLAVFSFICNLLHRETLARLGGAMNANSHSDSFTQDLLTKELVKTVEALKGELLATKKRNEELEHHKCVLKAMLESARVFDVGDTFLTIEKRGEGWYVVKDEPNVLNRDGKWEYEPMPSNRTEEFIERTRFSMIEACEKAADVIEKMREP